MQVKNEIDSDERKRKRPCLEDTEEELQITFQDSQLAFPDPFSSPGIQGYDNSDGDDDFNPFLPESEDGTYSEGEEVEESENSDDEHDDAHDRGAFERRNHAKELDEVCLKFAQEQTCQLTDLEKAMMFLRKITLLHQIPHSVADALLDPEAIKKLTLLSGMTMQLIDRKLAKVYVTGGHTVTLGSGTRIRYLPLTLSFLRKKLTQPDLGGEIILYWDGFRQFRAKGGSLGKNFFSVFLRLLFCSMTPANISLRWSLLWSSSRWRT